MIKKIFIWCIGELLIMPCIILLCCDNSLLIAVAIVYAFLLWHTPKLSTRIRKFWIDFWKVNFELANRIK